MRTWTAVVVALLLGAVPALAQNNREPDDSHKALKIVVGASALAIGAVVAAKSSQTTTVTNAFGRSETSTFSTSQLVTGLAIAGTGGFLLWDGMRDHHPRSPSTTFGVGLGKQSRQVFVRREW